MSAAMLFIGGLVDGQIALTDIGTGAVIGGVLVEIVVRLRRCSDLSRRSTVGERECSLVHWGFWRSGLSVG
jgi:hypothetical protein